MNSVSDGQAKNLWGFMATPASTKLRRRDPVCRRPNPTLFILLAATRLGANGASMQPARHMLVLLPCLSFRFRFSLIFGFGFGFRMRIRIGFGFGFGFRFSISFSFRLLT